MRVLLVQPPVRDFYQTAIRTQPLGLASLAAALRGRGHEPTVLDCQQPGRKRQLPMPCEFRYLQPFYVQGDISPFRLFSAFYHFGLSWDEVSAAIVQARPQAVGISCQFTPYVEETLRTAQIVKAIDPAISVILGGAHASALPAEVLKSPHVDYVVIGEGELTLPSLIGCLSEGKRPDDLAGIACKRGGRIIINPRGQFIGDLDSLPLPARDLLNTAWYREGNHACAMLLTSRGCPQRCTYCSVDQVMGSRLRYRTPEHVIAEMKACRELSGIGAFDFEDDNFTFDRQRCLKLLNLIMREFGERSLRLFAMNGLSLISLDNELLQAMAAAGFERLDASLGSHSPEINRAMDRPADRQRADEALACAAGLGLPVTTYIILGMPGHRLEDMIDAILYLMEQPTMLGPSVFYPSPGTRSWQAVQEAGLCDLTAYPLLRSSAFPVETRECSRLDLVTLMRLCRWVNFIKVVLCEKGIASCPFQDVAALFQAAPNLGGDHAGPVSARDAGLALSRKLLAEKVFSGARRMSKCARYRYEVFPYETSGKALDIFFRKAQSLQVRAGAGKSGSTKIPLLGREGIR